VPGRCHSASIPDTSGRPGLRAALAFLTLAGVVGLACGSLHLRGLWVHAAVRLPLYLPKSLVVAAFDPVLPVNGRRPRMGSMQVFFSVLEEVFVQ
jgi:hypothetical protein